MSLQVIREDDGPQIVLRVTGDINAANAEILETPLLEAAAELSTKLRKVCTSDWQMCIQ